MNDTPRAICPFCGASEWKDEKRIVQRWKLITKAYRCLRCGVERLFVIGKLPNQNPFSANELEVLHKIYKDISDATEILSIVETEAELNQVSQVEVLEQMRRQSKVLASLFAYLIDKRSLKFKSILETPFFARTKEEWKDLELYRKLEALFNETNGFARLIETNGFNLHNKPRKVILEVWINEMKTVLLNMDKILDKRYIKE